MSEVGTSESVSVTLLSIVITSQSACCVIVSRLLGCGSLIDIAIRKIRQSIHTSSCDWRYFVSYSFTWQFTKYLLIVFLVFRLNYIYYVPTLLQSVVIPHQMHEV